MNAKNKSVVHETPVCYFLLTQKRLLGPGTYNIKDSIHLNAEKPHSTRGVCETREARFKGTATVSSDDQLQCIAFSLEVLTGGGMGGEGQGFCRAGVHKNTFKLLISYKSSRFRGACETRKVSRFKQKSTVSRGWTIQRAMGH